MNSYYKNQVKFILGTLGIIMASFLVGFDKKTIKVAKIQDFKMITPPSLSSKDTIAIVAPAFWAGKAQKILPKAQAMFQDWGLHTIIGQSIGAKCGLLAGEDSLRRADLQNMLDDPTIKAIIVYRGGYGTTRIIDDLDFSQFLQHPKWFIGFSDLTTIHLQLHRLGVISIHGEMLWHFDDERYQSSWASLKDLLFGKPCKITAKPDVRNTLGEARAPVVGGNMMMICTNIGTSSDLDTKGKILVLEEVDETLYALDRMMVQLKRTGKLDDLAGLIVGGMVSMKDRTQDPFGKDAYSIIKEHTATYSYPVAFNFPIGHDAPNMAFPHGAVGQLMVKEESVILTFDE
jgi:muramoyltetrapeptide carboxypeptidase